MSLATALSVVILLRLSLFTDQNLSVCENANEEMNANTSVSSKTFFMFDGFLKWKIDW